MFKVYCLAVFSLLGLSLMAQGTGDIDKYTGLVSSGDIPEDFRTSWADKYKESLEKGSGDLEGDELEEFWMEQHHFIDSWLQSGRFSFGDPLNIYFNEIVDHILKDDPNLRSQIRVYVQRNPYANAYFLADGIIVLNVGLMAHARSEAEIAFVLSHEIAHFVRNHYVDRFKLREHSKNWGWFSQGPNPLALADKMITHSKENEIDADVYGLELFLKTDYSVEAVDSLLTTLNLSHIPYGRSEVSDNPFCIPESCFDLPKVFYRDKVKKIDPKEDYADERHSHPNIAERKAAVHAALVQKEVSDGVYFRLGEARFEELQKLARFECIREKVRVGNFTQALYDIYVEQQHYPNSKFLSLHRVKALYGLASFKAVDQIAAVLPSSFRVEGPYHQVVHLTKQMNRSQMVTIALQACFAAEKLYPEEKWISEYKSELAKYLLVYCDEDPDNFLKTEGNLPEFSKSKEDFRSPRAFIRAQQKHYNDFNRYLIKNQDDANWLKEEMISFIPYRDSVNNWKNMMADDREYILEEKREDILENGSGLNIREMVILNPSIRVYNAGDDREEIIEGLNQEVAYRQTLETLIKAQGIKGEFYYPSDFQASDVGRYNTYSRLEEWIYEVYDFSRFNLKPISIDIQDELPGDIRYVCRIIGVVDFEEKDAYFFGIFDLKKSELVYARYETVGRTLSMRDLEKETQKDLEVIYN